MFQHIMVTTCSAVARIKSKEMKDKIGAHNTHAHIMFVMHSTVACTKPKQMKDTPGIHNKHETLFHNEIHATSFGFGLCYGIYTLYCPHRSNYAPYLPKHICLG